ncbi:hypothetical protein GCM10022226_16550 [Sphaerisporangium flaviroseum]|uniref:Uncharacterized protein n=1 Tax=Sphaerisporangium flaviroseum TaxID=509199 RepID=A0ABP7HMD6_9ACTN
MNGDVHGHHVIRGSATGASRILTGPAGTNRTTHLGRRRSHGGRGQEDQDEGDDPGQPMKDHREEPEPVHGPGGPRARAPGDHSPGTPTARSLTEALGLALQSEVAVRARSLAGAVRTDGTRTAAEPLVAAGSRS